jgi:hypothetical protein
MRARIVLPMLITLVAAAVLASVLLFVTTSDGLRGNGRAPGGAEERL